MPMVKRPYHLPKMLTVNAAEIENGIDINVIEAYIDEHERQAGRYAYLEAMYKGFHDVYRDQQKPRWKPDNRLAVNFPRYITETFAGYGYGVPIKITHESDDINERILQFIRDNEMTDHDAEMVKNCCIYGHAQEYIYQDEEARTKVKAFTPRELFTVFDDTIKDHGVFSIRYGYHKTSGRQTDVRYGEILTAAEIMEFDRGRIIDRRTNPYGYIPVVEWKLNDERIGLFEQVAGLIEIYDYILSEKANDVQAFADAYLAVLGAELEEDEIHRIRDDRIINLYGTDDATKIVVDFLQRPSADGTQENTLNRLENLIYKISMVADISDEAFGNATSGIALSYKLLAMSNLALTFDRKIEKSLRKRYKIWSSLSTNVSDQNVWRDIESKMSRNIPRNVQEEVETAKNLEGITSKETQLSLLSIVSDPKSEIEKIDEEGQKGQDAVLNNIMFRQVTADEKQ